tara:strand:- start:2248 stop:3051 length:804 start_codon:yes stop_codon:yes gene_type:complete
MFKIKTTILILFLMMLLSDCTFSNKESSSDNESEVMLNEAENTNQMAPETSEPNLPTDYSLPKKLVYSKVIGYDLITDFYPIGWSTESKFAFIREPSDEACGCYFFDIIIMDMITDKIVWEWNFNDEGEGETRITVWNKNYKLFKSKLLKNKIIPADNFVLEPAYFKSKDKYYKIKHSVKNNSNWDFQNLEVFHIELSTTELGKKRILKQSYDEFDMILEAGISGVLKSPFEDRITVVYYEIIRGWEGPPNVTRFGLSGSHLMKGFN